LHRQASDEAQMEVSRLLQVIKTVGMRWGEETHLTEAENSSLVAVGGGARKARRSSSSIGLAPASLQ